VNKVKYNIFSTFFAPVTLTLTRWPGKYTGCANMNFLHWDSRKVSSDSQTDKHWDRHDRNYILRRFAGGQKCNWEPASIAVSQLCDIQVRCSSAFHGDRPSCELYNLHPALRRVDCTSFITCRYHRRFYTGAKLYFLTKTRMCKQIV